MEEVGLELGKRYTVIEDERNTGRNIGLISYIDDKGVKHSSMFVWLKLVTPVEELEPYYVKEISNGYRLMKNDGNLLANYWENHPQAKAAAEAECARLNAEYRKERKNG